MTDFSDFDPLFQRNEDDVRADFNARANAGMTPDDPEWVDVRDTGSFHMLTQPSVIEFASAYDRMNEVAAASILATSWGSYLDLHAASFNDGRIPASRATGQVTFSGADGAIVGTGARVSPQQTDPDNEPPVFETTQSGTIGGSGSVTLAVQAVDEGVVGNVDAGSIVFARTALPGVTGITNALPTDGGAEQESDDALKQRLRQRFDGKGSGTVADYALEALLWPGVGFVKVIPHWNGEGTVRVVVLDEEHNPLPGQVAALQTHFDPSPGLGEGWAPVNHVVTVSTPTPTAYNVIGAVAFKDGYSLDGAGGTIALRSAVVASIQRYLDELLPGDDVSYEALQAAFFVPGVFDVSGVRVGTASPPTGTTNVAIDDDHVAQPGTVTLS